MEPQDLINHPISWSKLKHYGKSPAHFLEAWMNPPEQTPAMLLGSALHCLALEPEKFEARYVTAPVCDRRTKAGRELWEEFEAQAGGRAVLTAEQFATANAMAGALLDSSTAAKVLSLCQHREHTIHWTDPLTDLPCKGVIDAWGDNGFILDIKTTDDAGAKGFARTVANYQYHGQAAFYMDGLASNGREVKGFFFVVVEKTPPFGVQTFMCSTDMLMSGRLLYQRLLERHAECCSNGEWPGYPDEVVSLDLPGWAA